VPLEDHRVVALGLTQMLTQSDIMMQEPNVFTWYNFHIRLVDVRVLIYNYVFINTRRGIVTALLNYSRNISMRAILITSWPELTYVGYPKRRNYSDCRSRS
jgi:hypothetical protein